MSSLFFSLDVLDDFFSFTERSLTGGTSSTAAAFFPLLPLDVEPEVSAVVLLVASAFASRSFDVEAVARGFLDGDERAALLDDLAGESAAAALSGAVVPSERFFLGDALAADASPLRLGACHSTSPGLVSTSRASWGTRQNVK